MVYGRKKFLTCFVLLVTIVFTLSPVMAATSSLEAPDKRAQSDDDDILIVGIDLAYPPPSDLEGDARITALGIDILERSVEDLEVEWVTMSTEEMYTALEAGEVGAIISSTPNNEDFSDAIEFADPYLSVRYGLFINYPVMRMIAEEHGLSFARQANFLVLQAVYDLALAVESQDEAAIADAVQTLSEGIVVAERPIEPIADEAATSIAEEIAASEYITSPAALTEPTINFRNLDGKRIGVLQGSAAETYLMTEEEAAETVPFETLESAFSALEQGELDGVLAETRASKAVILSNDFTALLINRPRETPQATLERQVIEEEYSIGVLEDSPIVDDFANLLDTSRENMVLDGTYAELLERYVGVPSPDTVIYTMLESLFDNDYDRLYLTVCESITYTNELPGLEDLAALDTGVFDFSDLRFDTQVERSGQSAELSVQGTYSVTIGDASDEYDATTMFDEDIPIEMIYDGDNWLFCPDVG